LLLQCDEPIDDGIEKWCATPFPTAIFARADGAIDEWTVLPELEEGMGAAIL
jgi:hypothetical protein